MNQRWPEITLLETCSGGGAIRPETASNGPKNRTLSPKQEAAALALAAGRTQDEAARASGAGTRTIKTWLYELPAFGRRIQELRAEITARALGRLVEGMINAAVTLSDLCAKGKSETVRLAAARAILEMGQKLRDSIELEERINALIDRINSTVMRGEVLWRERQARKPKRYRCFHCGSDIVPTGRMGAPCPGCGRSGTGRHLELGDPE